MTIANVDFGAFPFHFRIIVQDDAANHDFAHFGEDIDLTGRMNRVELNAITQIQTEIRRVFYAKGTFHRPHDEKMLFVASRMLSFVQKESRPSLESCFDPNFVLVRQIRQTMRHFQVSQRPPRDRGGKFKQPCPVVDSHNVTGFVVDFAENFLTESFFPYRKAILTRLAE